MNGSLSSSPNPESAQRRKAKPMTRPDIIIEIDDLTPENRYPLKSLAERLAALLPTRVIVNCAGPGAYVMQILRDYGLPVETSKKPDELTRWRAMFSSPEICSREISRLRDEVRRLRIADVERNK